MILLVNAILAIKDVTIPTYYYLFSRLFIGFLKGLVLSLTYLGHSAILYQVKGINIYVDPYLTDPVDFSKLPKGHVVLFSHGHFDHGVQLAPDLYKSWGCQFVAPESLVKWMKRKFKGKIPPEAYLPISEGESLFFGDVKIHAVPAHHPINKLGKTLMAVFARSKAPGKPVNGYYFEGYYHAGATVYTDAIAKALVGLPVHTACVPIGGKYATASPSEALAIAESINASRLVPMHWQPLIDQVFFRYQPSDLLKVAKEKESKVEIKPLVIGGNLEKANDDSLDEKLTGATG